MTDTRYLRTEALAFHARIADDKKPSVVRVYVVINQRTELPQWVIDALRDDGWYGMYVPDMRMYKVGHRLSETMVALTSGTRITLYDNGGVSVG